MASLGLVGICSAYMHSDQDKIRKQAALLFGSLASTIRVRVLIEESSYKGRAKLLFDKHIPAR